MNKNNYKTLALHQILEIWKLIGVRIKKYVY